MHTFEYSPLDASRREIRLLRPLQPAVESQGDASTSVISSRDSIIVCPDLALDFELIVVSLDENPDFTALSYVWGDASNPGFITVNSKQFQVTNNLNLALQHFQYVDIAPAIWIDSICINQRDKNEKTLQIGHMDTIYSKASRVLVWLGPSQNESDLVATIVHEFANEIRRHWNLPTSQEHDLVDYMDFENEFEMNSLLEKAIVCSGLNNKTTVKDFPSKCWKCVLGMPWWYRVWVIQEFVLARNVLFQVGSHKMHLEELSATLLTLAISVVTFALVQDRIHGSESHAGALGFDCILNMLVHRERYARNLKGGQDLYELLVNTYVRPAWPGSVLALGATEKADYIFGLVSLAKEHFHELRLKVDCEKSWQETYTDVAQALIQAGYMDIFAFCQNPAPFDSYNLPSWVPSWHMRIQNPNGWFKVVPTGRRSILGHSLFSASRNQHQDHSRDRFRQHPVGGQSIRSVTMTGIMVDKVLEAKTVYARSTATRSRQREVLFGNLYREIELLCAQSRKLTPDLYRPTVLSDAVWRMPIWDTEVDDDRGWRATQKSRERWQKSLVLFKAVRAHLAADDISRQSVGISSLHSAIRWIRVAFYRILSKYHYFRYMIPSMKHMWQYIKAPAKLWAQADLLSTKNDHISDTNMYLNQMEGGRPTQTFITQRGYIGMGPVGMRPGDIVYICFGARVPHILRQRDGNGYNFVGEVYVHGIMDGEFMSDDQEPEEFEIF